MPIFKKLDKLLGNPKTGHEAGPITQVWKRLSDFQDKRTAETDVKLKNNTYAKVVEEFASHKSH